jgi:hypothetical protein
MENSAKKKRAFTVEDYDPERRVCRHCNKPLVERSIYLHYSACPAQKDPRVTAARTEELC